MQFLTENWPLKLLVSGLLCNDAMLYQKIVLQSEAMKTNDLVKVLSREKGCKFCQRFVQGKNSLLTITRYLKVKECNFLNWLNLAA